MAEFARKEGSDRDPGFSKIVDFDFYDGPESGLAIYPSGEGVRFSSLGESKSRLFRAFELTYVGGNWWPLVKDIDDAPWAALKELQEIVQRAPAQELYVAVGRPYLDHLYVAAVTEEQLEHMRNPEEGLAFDLAHHLVKSSRAR